LRPDSYRVEIRHFEHSNSILFSSLEFAVWRNLWIRGCAIDLEISLRVDNISIYNNFVRSSKMTDTFAN